MEPGYAMRTTPRRLAKVALLTASFFALGLATANAQILPTIGEAPVNLATYTTSIAPTGVEVGSTTTFSMTIGNPKSLKSVLHMGAINVAIPAGFTNLSAGVPVTTSGAPWTSSFSGHTLRLRAVGSLLGSLSPGQSLTVAITATAPATTELDTFQVSAAPLAVGNLLVLPLFTLRNWPSTVQVGDNNLYTSSVVTCDPNLPCSSGDLANYSTMIEVQADPAPTTDTLTTTIGDPTSMLCKMGTVGDTADFTVAHRAKRVEYTVSLGYYNAGTLPSGVCYSGPKPFLTSNGYSAYNPVAGEYQGNLLPCMSTRFTPPCVEWSADNIYEGGGASRTFYILSPVGDPRISPGGSILKFASPST